MARKRRHHRRKSYAISNPFSVKGLLLKPKEMISKDFAIDAVFAAAGFILPQFAKQYIPANFQNTKIKYYAAKVGTVALLSVAAGMVSKKASRMVLLGGTVSILLDVWTEFRARTSAPAGTNAYYGQGIGDSEAYEPGVDVWYGGPQETLDADNSAPIFPNQNSDSGLLFDDEIDEQNGF